MLNDKGRLAVTAITIASALTALGATSASAAATASANPGHTSAATAIAPAVRAANARWAPTSSTTPYTICSYNPNPPHTGGLGCISDPGHNIIVHVVFNRDTTLNLVDQGIAAGFHWYLLRFNGTDGCLNWSPKDGYVYADSCIPGDHNEEWASPGTYHFGNRGALDYQGTGLLPALWVCKYQGNNPLVVIPLNYPVQNRPACKFTNIIQLTWLVQAAG